MGTKPYWKKHEVWKVGARGQVVTLGGELVTTVSGLPEEKAKWRTDMIVMTPTLLKALESFMESWNSGSAEDQSEMYKNCQRVVQKAKGGE